MSVNSLYTDLSGYYDLMCSGIDYQAQSNGIHRLHQVFGNSGKTHLDLACGSGPHVRQFLDLGYQSSGLDLNQPMLDLAVTRCPEAQFSLQNMSDFNFPAPVDLITCFLYSLHYNDGIKKLEDCVKSVHRALKTGGVFCFNAVDKNHISNTGSAKHRVTHYDSVFTFSSAWKYSGHGQRKSLILNIEKITAQKRQIWNDEHSMLALSFAELTAILSAYFEVHVFEHDYEKIIPWNQRSGNAIFTCVKL